MIVSLVLALTPTHPFRPNGFYGYQAKGWFMSEVRRLDSRLAEALHGQTGPTSKNWYGQRPYTVSSLIFSQDFNGNGGELLQPGDLCFLRLTSLSEPLSELLLEKLLPNPPHQIRLKNATFKLLGRARWREWDVQITYDQLFQQCLNIKTPRVTLEFSSPTAFRSQGVDLNLPTPDLVWGSLHRRWSAFAPADLAIDFNWGRFAGRCIVASDFHLRASKIIFKGGAKGAATGCIGRITYRLLAGKDCGEWIGERPGAESYLHQLASFALFSGVGHHTAAGLGQARCVSHGRGRQEGRFISSRYQHITIG